MNLLDLTFPTPVENLAADEALLDVAETSGAGEILRFWESSENFVVVGYANTVANEVDIATCESSGVPVMRRCTGGGTVLQGPGCLNYALILKIEPTNALQNISLANQFIMGRNRTALQTLLKRPVRIQGHTDLTLRGQKFSGNSQRRRKHFLLFHGTFLLNFDLALVARLLRSPSQQPDYRAGRPHGSFLINLEIPAAEVKAALAQAWQATETFASAPRNQIATLARDKYATRGWSFKF